MDEGTRKEKRNTLVSLVAGRLAITADYFVNIPYRIGKRKKVLEFLKYLADND